MLYTRLGGKKPTSTQIFSGEAFIFLHLCLSGPNDQCKPSEFWKCSLVIGVLIKSNSRQRKCKVLFASLKHNFFTCPFEVWFTRVNRLNTRGLHSLNEVWGDTQMSCFWVFSQYSETYLLASYLLSVSLFHRACLCLTNHCHSFVTDRALLASKAYCLQSHLLWVHFSVCIGVIWNRLNDHNKIKHDTVMSRLSHCLHDTLWCLKPGLFW